MEIKEYLVWKWKNIPKPSKWGFGGVWCPIDNNKKDGYFTIQLHAPRWKHSGGDYYFMAPTVFRFTWNSLNTRKDCRDFGFGVVVFGFGVGVCWGKDV